MTETALALWLVRHGETTASRDGTLAGWADLPLTERGIEQARAVGPVLEGESFTAVWSSDLVRALTTARLAWGEPCPEPRLREINFGELEGRDWKTLDPVYKQALIEFNGFYPPGGESLAQVRTRVEEFLATLPSGRHLLFTHGGVIRLLTREAGDDDFVPTGSVVALDWTTRRMLSKRACPIPSPLPFTK
ncbi:MAG: histidine phosphatase family protein [Thermoanaerobaculales bacterium]